MDEGPPRRRRPLVAHIATGRRCLWAAWDARRPRRELHLGRMALAAPPVRDRDGVAGTLCVDCALELLGGRDLLAVERGDDVTTGRVVSGPAEKKIVTYDTDVRGNEIYLKKPASPRKAA